LRLARLGHSWGGFEKNSRRPPEAEFWLELHFKAAWSESSELAQAVALDWAGAVVALEVVVVWAMAWAMVRESATAE